jgi:hypothetical protein
MRVVWRGTTWAYRIEEIEMAKPVYKTTITLFSGSKKDADEARKALTTAIAHILNFGVAGADKATMMASAESVAATRDDPEYNTEWSIIFG